MTDRKLKIGMRGVIGLVVIVGFVVIIAYLVIETPTLNAQSAGLIGTMIGYLSAKADSVVMWYFGGSENADKQTENIREIYRDSIAANQELLTEPTSEPTTPSPKNKPPVTQTSTGKITAS